MYKSILAALILVVPSLSQAQELSDAEIEELLEVKIRFATHMAFQPNVIRAVETQNGQGLSLAEIKERDQSWIDANGAMNPLIREITRNEETSDIPVVFVSTKNQRADHIWAEKQGAKMLLTKPVDSETIVKQLNTYI